MYPASPEHTARAHIYGQARRDARRLRREAVDDFWRGADVLWQRGLAGAQGQVQRGTAGLRARLVRDSNRSNTLTTKKV
ncbi:hypothetical protein MCEMSEM22_00835 [Comamonadaceae bacterium]